MSKKGFTFFEIAVTMAILVIGVSGFLSIFSTSLRTARDVKGNLVAAPTAYTAVEYLAAKNFIPFERYNIDFPINGQYASIEAGRLDQFKFNPDDVEWDIPRAKPITGNVSINPNNSPDMLLELVHREGVITREDLLKRDGNIPTGRLLYSNKDSVIETHFLKFRPKGGNYTFLHDGNELELKSDKVYVFLAPVNDPMKVILYNSLEHSQGSAMGRWFMNVSGGDVIVTENMDGYVFSAGSLYTMKVTVYENKSDQLQNERNIGIFFIRKWFRK